jgi:hypothetical protein
MTSSNKSIASKVSIAVFSLFIGFMAGSCIFGSYLYIKGFEQKYYRVEVIEKKAVCTFDVANTPIKCEQTRAMLKLVNFEDRYFSPQSNYFNHDTWMTMQPGLKLDLKINRAIEYHPYVQFWSGCSIFALTLFLMIAVVLGLDHVIRKLCQRFIGRELDRT